MLVEVPGPAAAAVLALRARAQGVAADEVVPAAASVLFDGVADLAALHRLLDRLLDQLDGPLDGPGGDPRTDDADAAVPAPVEVPVRWDGPDLAFVAEHWGVGVRSVVERMEAAVLVSAFCGFAPGFAYLAGLPGDWSVPRLADPRPRVPAGSVALADTWCGIYPVASPGGWRLLGTTDVVLWDAGAEAPALLAPGTRVRLVTASS